MRKHLLKFIKAHHVLMCLLLVIGTSCNKSPKVSTIVSEDNSLDGLNSAYSQEIEKSILALDSLLLANDFNDKKAFYLKARKSFKTVEPILAFVDKENYKSLNAPNILKVEEEDATDIKIREPFGFQVIEENLFVENHDSIRLKNTIDQTINRLKLIHQNSKLRLSDYHILWLIRDEIIRIALTGITGFDSPVLEESLIDATISYQGMLLILENYKSRFHSDEMYNKWIKEINNSINDLQNSSFNEFDRFSFIKNHTHHQLQLILDTKQDWNIDFPYELAFSNEVKSLFSKETFNLNFFADIVENDPYYESKVKLGKKLFNDVRLSSDGSMSCARCHQKDKAFTDGLKTFPTVNRNSPTLTYAALQQSFFMDGRAGNLEGQIVGVVENPDEFHTDLKTLTVVIKSDSIYSKSFDSIYQEIDDMSIRNAIASYVRSLNKFNSKFDNNINGIEHSLSEQEINGFNLFMGKAKCATCHFAPVFNGTVPPNFTESEMELLGVPNDTISNMVSVDLGRYNVFHTEERKHFFKTPTIRNVSKTAPYMHNGVYQNLEQVLDFYNNGGGVGLGIELEYQTLPTDSLQLSKDEIRDIISFMKSLEDQ